MALRAARHEGTTARRSPRPRPRLRRPRRPAGRTVRRGRVRARRTQRRTRRARGTCPPDRRPQDVHVPARFPVCRSRRPRRSIGSRDTAQSAVLRSLEAASRPSRRPAGADRGRETHPVRATRRSPATSRYTARPKYPSVFGKILGVGDAGVAVDDDDRLGTSGDGRQLFRACPVGNVRGRRLRGARLHRPDRDPQRPGILESVPEYLQGRGHHDATPGRASRRLVCHGASTPRAPRFPTTP